MATVANDTDGDGVCDELEIEAVLIQLLTTTTRSQPMMTDCIIQVGGCTLPLLVTTIQQLTSTNGSCDFYVYLECQWSGCADPLACNFGEKSCEYFDDNGELCATVGCMEESVVTTIQKLRFRPCDYTSCATWGCTNENAVTTTQKLLMRMVL